MSIVIRDEPVAVALAALPWRDISLYGPGGVLLGRFTPGRRSWRSATWNGESGATGDEVVALMRELRRVPQGVIGDRSIRIGNAALALMLAESDETGVPLYDPDGNLLGRFIPEPRPGSDEPHVVGSDE